MAKKTLIFVTGNANKLKEVKELVGENFPFKITNKKEDLAELQGTRTFITQSKVLEAQKKIKGPVLVEDTCLCFNAFNDLPGPYIKWFLDAIKQEGLCKLLSAFDDKTAEAVCTFGYHSGEEGDKVELFEGVVKGSIVDVPRGGNNFGWDSCFVPEGYETTFAEMSAEEKNKVSHRRRAIEKLSAHFEKKDSGEGENGEETLKPGESPKKRKGSPGVSDKSPGKRQRQKV